MIDVVIPIKDLSLVKTRLENVLSPDERAGLALAMLRDLLMTLRSSEIGDIWLVAKDDRVFDIGHEFGTRPLREPRSQGYNFAASAGLQAARPGRPVVILPADLPLATSEDIARMVSLQNLRKPGVGIVPDRHNRGTNALYLSAPDLISPAFGNNSFPNHQSAAARAGISATIVPLSNLARDIDCAEDLMDFARQGIPGTTTDFLKQTNFAQALEKQQVRSVA